MKCSLFLEANPQRVSLQVEAEATKSRSLVRLEPLRAKAAVNGFPVGNCNA